MQKISAAYEVQSLDNEGHLLRFGMTGPQKYTQNMLSGGFLDVQEMVFQKGHRIYGFYGLWTYREYWSLKYTKHTL